MSSHYPTLAIAQRDRPVRVLGCQGLVQPLSKVQTLRALSIDIKCVRDTHLPPHVALDFPAFYG